MLQVDERFEIAAPRRDVFALWTRFDRFTAFMTGVDGVFAETAVRLRWQLSVAGVQPTLYAVVTERVQDARIAWTSVDLTTMAWWIELEPLCSARTLMTVRAIWSPRGDDPPRPGAHELDERTIRCDLQRFRMLAEAPAEGALSRAA